MSWTKTTTGYELETPNGTATVEKTGKAWTVTYRGETRDLGRKASFDHAEGAIVEIDA